MPDYGYPTAATLREIEMDKLPRLTAQRPIFDIMPMEDDDAAILLWEQEDNYTGLQQIRGMNGFPPSVSRTGIKRYQEFPGVYGEFMPIDELELTLRRKFGTFNVPIDIADLVMRAQDRLLGRRLDRIEKIGWDLLTNGTFSVSTAAGTTLATGAYTLQTFSSSVPWATAATATPLADFRTVRLKHRGHSVDFGAGAKAYANTVTVNRMLANTNQADLYGRRVAGLATANSLPGVNALLAQDALPTIVEYDEGYLDDSKVFQPFLPDGLVVLVGQRPAGQRVASYRMTRNANNPDLAPGPYTRVIDRGEDQVPRNLEVHDGHNGGPVIFYPSAVVAMTVS